MERDLGPPDDTLLRVVAEVEAAELLATAEFARITSGIEVIERDAQRSLLWLDTARPAVDRGIPLAEIVRAYPANQLGLIDRLGVFADQGGGSSSATTRASRTARAASSAIFGTVLMTLIMCLVVVPFGVLASLYLREYREGRTDHLDGAHRGERPCRSASIVFGVFGLGFFCYIVGSSINDLFYAARLPQPTFGKGGLLGVPDARVDDGARRDRRDRGGAVRGAQLDARGPLCVRCEQVADDPPHRAAARSGIMTGAILAMARGAGEVAPLMLVGAVKLAPELPFDLSPPFGTNRSFMHLGFHVYDLGFRARTRRLRSRWSTRRRCS